MRFITLYVLIFGWFSLCAGEDVSKVTTANRPFKVPEQAEMLLERYCYECHEDGMAKGNIRFDDLESLTHGQRIDLLNNSLEQVFSGEMPAKKGEQPSSDDREKLIKWFRSELEPYGAPSLDDKLRYYKYGNYINHEKLFSGEIKDAPYTKARRWRVNELIYNERINDVFELKDKARRSEFSGVIKPFNLPTDPGVAYYDTEIIEGGHFLTLMSNAKWVVDKQLKKALVDSGEFIFSDAYMQAKAAGGRALVSRFPDEAWNAKFTPEPMMQIIMRSEPPTDAMLENAIKYQFMVALQREPAAAELTKYMGFTKGVLKISDKTSALKKMMVSVLMEPEFLYRNEFGGGKPDEHGRIMLTPREGSYALAYALTDKVPDEELANAARTGKLNSKEDYEREVRRMLDDAALEKPRILRFFQDYFGYKGVHDVFKDEERFVGAYNPHRVISRTYIYRVPGRLVRDADLVVQRALDKDQKVFETLLTTDEYFVNHTGDNEFMRQKVMMAQSYYADLRRFYMALKDSERKNYVRILKELRLESRYVRIGKDGKEEFSNDRFQRDMRLAETFFGKDGSKRTEKDGVYLPNLGEGIDHATKMYNFDHTTWDYVAEQPFKVPNRIGMLTHPAWLVANSHNAATDLIHRGKWVREKLLGGFVRDVPITVDAKVPEDPHSTMRERFILTEGSKCWSCHEKMNPLGYPFESYDDFGRYRTEEAIEYPENIIKTEQVWARNAKGIMSAFMVNHYKTKPVDATGFLEGTGDESLDGPVKDVPDMIHRLAKSDRVRQVFIRNVFRYYMGRNETLSDSQTLIEADRVYRESGGSFKELTVSLLTSDSFIYRK